MVDKFNQEKQQELFEEFIRRKFDIQHLAGVIQNNWNEHEPTPVEMSEWFNKAITFTRGIEKQVIEIKKFYDQNREKQDGG
jgi:hypothetical protein